MEWIEYGCVARFSYANILALPEYSLSVCLTNVMYVMRDYECTVYTETVDQLYRTIDFPVLPAAAMYAVARMYGTKSEESFLL